MPHHVIHEISLKGGIMVNNYEISSNTCAVISVDDNLVKIIENGKEFYVKDSSINIINNSCMYYGSTFEGRCESAKRMLNGFYKLPIVIEESAPIVFFPISSPKHSKCIWISLQNIEKVSKCENGTLVSFVGGHNFSFDRSREVIDNQIARATRLKCILYERQSKK